MKIADAIEEVWRQQEPYMLQPPAVSRRANVPTRRRPAYDINMILASANEKTSFEPPFDRDRRFAHRSHSPD
jgi:hypothetical protein